MGPIVHLEHAAEDAPVAPESLLPVGVAQHEHRIGPQVVVGVDEGATKEWPDAEDIEEVGGHHPRQHVVRLAAVEQRERHAVVLHEPRHRSELLPVVDDFLRGERNVFGAGHERLLAGDHQPIAVLIRERPQEHAVDQAEDGGVRPDPEAEGEHHERGVPRRGDQGPDSVSNVAKQLVELDGHERPSDAPLGVTRAGSSDHGSRGASSALIATRSSVVDCPEPPA